MEGTLFGVGVGPGDPDLMTYKAVETIERCQVLAVPARGKEHAVSYKIAAGKVKHIEEKECLNLDTPMTKDRQILEENYKKAAEKIINELKKGKDVAYLTLGDPTVYSTYIYIHRIVKEKGYHVEIINGIPSFCASLARLGDSLADRCEQLHIIPSSYAITDALEYPGTKVLMKSASKLGEVKEELVRNHREAEVKMVENCGMPEEHIYENIDEIPETAGYYTLLVVKEPKK